MPAHIHHQLDKLQEQSFWFRSRNELIQWAIKKYFSDVENVLEIGCGSGFVLNGIRSVLPVAHLSATEIYTHGLHYAKARVSPPHEFLQVDARQLPFEHEFDLIGAFDVLEHIEEDACVMQNIRRALKPNGGVMITVPQHPWLWSRADDVACHKRRYTHRQLIDLLQQHGFKIIFDTSFMLFLLPLMLLQRMRAKRNVEYDQTRELALPVIVDKLFSAILKSEQFCIRAGARFPLGGSRMIAAKLE